ncbi:MAG: cupredoxin domain-containing protein [Actinomycetota bacterium]|nr:cupredoxin domain-containing protein [Actinomycetota bacterium]
MRNKWLILGMVGALGLGFAGCGGDDDDDDDAAGGDAAVTAEGFAFEVGAPVAAGTEFTVTNVDPATHTFTADDDAFNEELSAETDVTVTAPAEPGEYAFHCEIHTNMTGTLVVE